MKWNLTVKDNKDQIHGQIESAKFAEIWSKILQKVVIMAMLLQETDVVQHVLKNVFGIVKQQWVKTLLVLKLVGTQTYRLQIVKYVTMET